MQDLLVEFESACLINKDIKAALQKYVEDITPIRAYQLFERIRDQDVYVLDMDPLLCKPVHLLMTHVPVPPVCLRPSVQASEGMTNEDDLTVKLQEAIQLNNLIRVSIEQGLGVNKLVEDWGLLQATLAQYINSETPGLPLNLLGNRSIRALCQRLKGKQGRFRKNLSGKRVDFTGRTVISPDPNVAIDQVVMPELMAKVITYPEMVSSINLERMKRHVINGPTKHPGANFVRLRDGTKVSLQYANRRAIADQLRVGDVVERHLIDDDRVLFNRQPSLHRLSMMCHRVKVMPWRTLRFNECVCTPYNADFDGDEMNIHVPQTEEARAEAALLMAVKPNMISPRNGDPIIGATQDFLTASYLISQRDVFLDRAEFCRACGYMGDAEEWVELPHPTIIKPVELWTGKQVINVLLRPNPKSRISANIEVKEKNYTGKRECMCPNDGWVLIRNSQLMCGNIGKTIIGGGSKDGLVYSLIKDNNPNVAAECLLRIAKFSGRWLANRGMSIGISDVWPFQELVEEKNKLIRASYAYCDELIGKYNRGEIALKAGFNMEQSLEHYINGELGKIRDSAGELLRARLPKSNAPLIMAICGSKGSYLNLCQMIACVGQQTVSGNRIPNGFSERSLPHFEKQSKYPAAKGFVSNSFFTGLNPTEFFFHTMGGREGLVDSSVKTSDTGYMQRRLMKALEDISVKYDSTVRNSSEEIIQFLYGDDSLDSLSMEDVTLPVPLHKLLNRIRSTSAMYPTEPSLLPYELKDRVRVALATIPRTAGPVTAQFCNALLTFVDKYAESLAQTRRKLGLEPGLDAKDTVMRAEGDEIIDRNWKICASQLQVFFRICWEKYSQAYVHVGEAVGAVAAMSIGEPSTQMTLKTFHFAGVATMNITLGVPRIQEIINGVKDIATPLITATLKSNKEIISARIAKGRAEKTLLRDVASAIKEVYSEKGCYITVKLDQETIESRRQGLSAEKIRLAIVKTSKLRVKEDSVSVIGPYEIRIRPSLTTVDSRQKLFFSLMHLKNNLENVIVSGIPTIQRAVINKSTDTEYNLFAEGSGLQEVMAIPEIDGTKTRSNHILEVEKVLGIEAARMTIIEEMKYVLKQHGLTIDPRHLSLLADVKTFKGTVLGITRFGVPKMRDSTLMLASFERTVDYLFDAAVHCRQDKVQGVSECIITARLCSHDCRGCLCLSAPAQ